MSPVIRNTTAGGSTLPSGNSARLGHAGSSIQEHVNVGRDVGASGRGVARAASLVQTYPYQHRSLVQTYPYLSTTAVYQHRGIACPYHTLSCEGLRRYRTLHRDCVARFNDTAG
eukprot:1173919-Rhodomonas_salina.2